MGSHMTVAQTWCPEGSQCPGQQNFNASERMNDWVELYEVKAQYSAFSVKMHLIRLRLYSCNCCAK